MKCPNCSKEIKDSSKFCRYCGTRIETSSEGVKCPNCGFENKAQVNRCNKCGKKLIEETNNDSNINQNNENKIWVITSLIIAICFIILIVTAATNNYNGEYGVTDESEDLNSAKGVHLTIHNDEDYGDTIKKGHPILVQMKDTAYWEAMEGCVVSVSLKNKETGEEYDGDYTIGENSYAYIDTDELPIGEYELYASYYSDEDHYANYYKDIEIVN